MRIALILAIACAALPSDAGEAERAFRGPVAAAVERVVDGDTIDVRAAIWIDQTLNVRVRIDGVDAPEIKGRCAGERRAAMAARDYLTRRLGTAQVQLTSIAYDKYGGRVRASVADAKGDVGQALVAQGLARPYHGEHRQPWCTAS